MRQKREGDEGEEEVEGYLTVSRIAHSCCITVFLLCLVDTETGQTLENARQDA